MNQKDLLRKRIRAKELQIKKLHLHEASTDACCALYNSLILEKAILKKELESLEKNKVFECIKNIFSKQEKRICDYFRSSC